MCFLVWGYHLVIIEMIYFVFETGQIREIFLIYDFSNIICFSIGKTGKHFRLKIGLWNEFWLESFFACNGLLLFFNKI